MPLELKVVSIDKPEAINFILGQSLSSRLLRISTKHW